MMPADCQDIRQKSAITFRQLHKQIICNNEERSSYGTEVQPFTQQYNYSRQFDFLYSLLLVALAERISVFAAED
jgi:hypothetical protein